MTIRYLTRGVATVFAVLFFGSILGGSTRTAHASDDAPPKLVSDVLTAAGMAEITLSENNRDDIREWLFGQKPNMPLGFVRSFNMDSGVGRTIPSILVVRDVSRTCDDDPRTSVGEPENIPIGTMQIIDVECKVENRDANILAIIVNGSWNDRYFFVSFAPRGSRKLLEVRNAITRSLRFVKE